MSIDTRQITVSGLRVSVVRKAIKNLHLGVYPPHGRVRVAAPLRLTDDAVRLAVVSRLGWIRRQQAKFLGQDRQPPREYAARESHYYLGRRYLLNLVSSDAPPRIGIRNATTIDLHIWKNADAKQRERILQEWYRQQLKRMIPSLIEKWERVVGVNVADWRVKLMKTKWGSCSATDRRIWINLELVKTPVRCLEYVLVHEMVHLLERHHNERFKAHMDKFMPQWRHRKNELARGPLGHFEWDY